MSGYFTHSEKYITVNQIELGQKWQNRLLYFLNLFSIRSQKLPTKLKK